MKEIVRYDNKLNTVYFKDFNAIEIDLLMTICSRMKYKKLDIITFSFEKLKHLSKYDCSQSNKKFISDLEKTYDKLIKLDFKIGNDKNFTKFVLFSEYTVSGDDETVTIGVNPKFKFVLNEFEEKWTRFELQEFLDLKSKYSKSIYRFLKQFKDSGKWLVNYEEFKKLLDIPKSYDTSRINEYIIKIALKELKPHFENLTLKKIKKGKGKDWQKIIRLEWFFKPQKNEKEEQKKPKDKDLEKNSDIELLGEFNNIKLSDENYKTLLDELNGDEKTLKHLIECASEAKNSGKYKSQTDFSRVYYLINNYNDKNTFKKYKIKTPEYIKQEIKELNNKKTKKKEITEADEQAYKELMAKLNG